MNRFRKISFVAVPLLILAFFFFNTEDIQTYDAGNDSAVSRDRESSPQQEISIDCRLDQSTENSIHVVENRVEVVSYDEVYKHYIEQAESGNVEAQFAVSAMLFRCHGYSPRNLEYLYQMADRIPITPELVDEVQRKGLLCKGLSESLTPTQINEHAISWLSVASDNGHPLAKASYQLLFTDSTQDEVLPALSQSLKYAKEDGYQRLEFIKTAAMFQSKFGNLSANAVVGDNLQLNEFEELFAWEYLVCEHDQECTKTKFEQVAFEHFTPGEVDLIRQRGNEILEAFESQDATKIGLVPERR